MKIDLEKLICSLIKQANGNIFLKFTMSNFIEALKEQGLEYKDDKITQIENEPKFKIGQTIIYKGTENIAPTKMTISDIAQGQYWDDNCCIVPISDQDNWELVEQKQKWTEEDERLFISALWHIKNSVSNSGKNNGEFEIYNWFKSLKDRVQQPKQEWDEEDRKNYQILQKIICDSNITANLANKLSDWLKSLRPQNTWLPSDEQMKALAEALSLAKNCGEESAFDLRTLHEQLKKLRKE